jgi:inner membrane protein
MEPVTHMLTGAVLARTGFNRRAAYATTAMVIAAELPDIDTLWSFGGPVAGFEHHRGITHTFVGVPFEAAAVTVAFYLYHRLRKRPTKAAPNWLLLYAGTLLALLSHLLLDWTNNYGIRPFFPFNPHWYAGSFVFIFEPMLFGILILALVLPPLFALINAEVGARKRAFPSPVWSWLALLLIAALYVLRYDQRQIAMHLVAQIQAQPADRIFASPHPTDPFLWSVIADSPDAYRLYNVTTRSSAAETPNQYETLYKPQTTLPLLVAKRSYLGRVYLDWSMYPVLTQIADTSDPNHPLTRVTFADARFMYASALMNGRDNPPLSGSVLLDMQEPEGSRVIETKFDGRIQK